MPPSSFSFASLFKDVGDVIKSVPKTPEEIQNVLKDHLDALKAASSPANKEAFCPNDACCDKSKSTTDSATTMIPIYHAAFKHPILYLPENERHVLSQFIVDDLEMLKTKATLSLESESDALQVPDGLYTHVFAPSTVYGRKHLNFWSEHYTTNIDYLRDTQQLLRSFNAQEVPNAIMEHANKRTCEDVFLDIDRTWCEIKETSPHEFKQKFSYVETNFLEKLNNSSHFMQIFSVYNISSPLIALATPILVLIFPFFILKMKGFEITVSGYIDVLKEIISNYAAGRLFTHFNDVSWDQRIYMFVSLIFYFVQIYQNIMACIRYYKNMYLIHDHLVLVNTYLKGTGQNMRMMLARTASLPSYAAFRSDLLVQYGILDELSKALDTIQPFKIGLSNLANVGYVLKHYYQLFSSTDISHLLNYSFGFNALLEHYSSCKRLIDSGILHPCTFGMQEDTDAESDAEEEDVDESDGENDENDENAEDHASSDENNEDTDEENNEDKNVDKNDKKKEKKQPHTWFRGQHYAPLTHAVKNDISLDKQIIVTGPNAAGKTTIIKSTLFNIVLSQQIGYGFYSSANIVPYHYLHCYLNIPDTSGRDSLFQAESRRCKEILDCMSENPDKRHFCIFDELYSGTNPYEAVAAAYGYIDYVSQHSNVDLMLTTHYIELCKLLADHDHIRNMHMDTVMNAAFDLTYLYKVVPGISSIKGGVKVLNDLEYPREIVEKAALILETYGK